MSRAIDVGTEGIKKTVRIMIAESGVESISDLAEILGKKDTTLRSALNNNALRVADFLRIARELGYKVTVEKNATGKELSK